MQPRYSGRQARRRCRTQLQFFLHRCPVHLLLFLLAVVASLVLLLLLIGLFEHNTYRETNNVRYADENNNDGVLSSDRRSSAHNGRPSFQRVYVSTMSGTQQQQQQAKMVGVASSRRWSPLLQQSLQGYDVFETDSFVLGLERDTGTVQVRRSES